MVKRLKKIFKVVINTILAVYLALLVVLVAPSIFGIRSYMVTSGSMEPVISVGSMVYVRPVDYMDISVNDVITFLIDQDTRVTHRVVDIDDAFQMFQTKGDNNDIPDASPVSYKNVMGKVILHIPYLGYLLSFLSNVYGKISAICFLFVLVVLSELASNWNKSADSSEEEKENTSDDEVESSDSENYLGDSTSDSVDGNSKNNLEVKE